jgi:hypothetical protein
MDPLQLDHAISKTLQTETTLGKLPALYLHVAGKTIRKAVKYNNLRILSELLSYNLSNEFYGEGLIKAVKLNNLEAAKLLLTKTYPSPYISNALEIAVSNQNIPMIQLLLTQKVTPLYSTQVRSLSGDDLKEALVLAKQKGNPLIIALLQKHDLRKSLIQITRTINTNKAIQLIGQIETTFNMNFGLNEPYSRYDLQDLKEGIIAAIEDLTEDELRKLVDII